VAVAALQAVMDRRIAFRLAILVAGMLLADDRRTCHWALQKGPLMGASKGTGG
jgi:hypothetical protein